MHLNKQKIKLREFLLTIYKIMQFQLKRVVQVASAARPSHKTRKLKFFIEKKIVNLPLLRH